MSILIWASPQRNGSPRRRQTSFHQSRGQAWANGPALAYHIAANCPSILQDSRYSKSKQWVPQPGSQNSPHKEDSRRRLWGKTQRYYVFPLQTRQSTISLRCSKLSVTISSLILRSGAGLVEAPGLTPERLEGQHCCASSHCLPTTWSLECPQEATISFFLKNQGQIIQVTCPSSQS